MKKINLASEFLLRHRDHCFPKWVRDSFQWAFLEFCHEYKKGIEIHLKWSFVHFCIYLLFIPFPSLLPSDFLLYRASPDKMKILWLWLLRRLVLLGSKSGIFYPDSLLVTEEGKNRNFRLVLEF